MLMTVADDDGKPAGKFDDDELVKEALDRWTACKDWQGTADERSREDTKFANGDARNGFQWPNKIWQERTGGEVELPTLTINKTRSHNDIIINEMSKSGFGIKIRPAAGGASYKSAQVMESIVRHIENISKASTQYRKVAEHQVDGGIGYMLLETRFVSPRSRNQDIYLRAASDPFAVYLDPWSREPDGSDANFGFVWERKPRKEFNRKYPQWKNKVGATPLAGMEPWISDKEIVTAKYFRKSQVKDTYVWWQETPDSPEVEMLASEIKDEAGIKIYKALMQNIKDGVHDGGTRAVFDDKVEWFLIAGDKIIERGDWAGKYIPICRCPGREIVIDAILDRKGHTRPLIDAQRMLNYGNSCAVQVVALQTKTQWLAPSRAVEGQEQWKSQNVNNFAVLFYNDIDDEASDETKVIPPPQRIEPPKPSEGWLRVAQDAERQMMMVSGQFQAQMGENDTQSAASGKAINERKEQGDVATYHFPEHMSNMKQFIGVQLLDLIPKIYDTKRTLQVLDDTGEKHWITVDPDQKEAAQKLQEVKENEEAAHWALNPTVGEYECVSDPGPDFATQRQEAWNAITQLMVANKELVAVIGDLLFQYGDFPGADAIQERLRKEIQATKAYLFDESKDPQITGLMDQVQKLTALNSELMTKLADANLKVRSRDERRDVDAFNAETKRIEAMVNALSKIMLTPQQQAQMRHEIEKDAHQHIYSTIEQANQADIDAQGREHQAGIDADAAQQQSDLAAQNQPAEAQ